MGSFYYGFLQASEFASYSLIWQHTNLSDDRYTVLIEQPKTDLFRHGHLVTTVHVIGTSICPVRALRLYAEATTPLHDFKGGKFSRKYPSQFSSLLLCGSHHLHAYIIMYIILYRERSPSSTDCFFINL